MEPKTWPEDVKPVAGEGCSQRHDEGYPGLGVNSKTFLYPYALGGRFFCGACGIIFVCYEKRAKNSMTETKTAKTNIDMENKEAWTFFLYAGAPYVSGEQPQSGGWIKLNTNENPYPPAPGVARVLREISEQPETLRLYPPADGGALREALAVYHGVAPENVFVSNGSDETLAFAFRACFGGGTIPSGGGADIGGDSTCLCGGSRAKASGADVPILFTDVTYSFYPVWCDFFGLPYETVETDAALRADVSAYTKQSRGVVFCNPNAPTGIGEGETFVRALLDTHRDRIVLVDEAYADFADFSAIPLLKEYQNLIIVRSFSKGRSMAGVRLGYALGAARSISALNAVKDSFNSYPIDRIAIATGTASLQDEPYYRETIRKIVRTREETASSLSAMGYDVPPSQANFLFMGCGSAARAKALFGFLRDAKILVRYFEKPRIDDRLRVSVGTDAEMAAFLQRVKEFKG